MRRYVLEKNQGNLKDVTSEMLNQSTVDSVLTGVNFGWLHCFRGLTIEQAEEEAVKTLGFAGKGKWVTK